MTRTILFTALLTGIAAQLCADDAAPVPLRIADARPDTVMNARFSST
jgi:hypothetical protein